MNKELDRLLAKMLKLTCCIVIIAVSFTLINAGGPIPGYQCPPEDVSTGCMGPTDCLYPNPESCETFIQCTAAGLAYVMPCPQDLHFNNRDKRCDYPNVANCSAPQPTNPPSTQSPGFVCPSDDIINTQCMGPKDCLYPHPTNCHQFIHCEVNADGVTGRPTVKDCPANLEWNDSTKQCDWPSDDTCGNGGQTPSQEPVITSSTGNTNAGTRSTANIPSQEFVCPVEDIQNTQCMGPKDCLYPHPKHCDQYIHCEVNADGQTGRPTIKDCPDGLYWDDTNKICNWPDQSTCPASPTPDTHISTTGRDCDCSCSSTPVSPDIPSPTPALEFTCPAEDIANTQCMGPKDCLYPHPTNCDQFIHCEVNADGVTGRPTVKNCPPGLEWNDNTKQCDWPSQSTCVVVSTPVDTELSTPKSDFICPEKDIIETQCMGPKDCLYPHPSACNLYIHCEVNADGRTGRPTVKNCPGILEWNNREKICDWPGLSTCRYGWQQRRKDILNKFFR